jgi:hypothetical protein
MYKVNNVLNLTVIPQKAYTESSAGQHRPPTKAEEGTNAMEELC